MCWVMRRPLQSESLFFSSKHFSLDSLIGNSLLFSFWEISSTLSFIPLLTFLLMSFLISKSSCSMCSFFFFFKSFSYIIGEYHHFRISSVYVCVYVCVLFLFSCLFWSLFYDGGFVKMASDPWLLTS